MHPHSRFHYSPYLVDSASETQTWVATVGAVITYGISVDVNGQGQELGHVVPSDALSLPLPDCFPTAPEFELTLQ